jgi:hypothetical protein
MRDGTNMVTSRFSFSIYAQIEQFRDIVDEIWADGGHTSKNVRKHVKESLGKILPEKTCNEIADDIHEWLIQVRCMGLKAKWSNDVARAAFLNYPDHRFGSHDNCQPDSPCRKDPGTDALFRLSSTCFIPNVCMLCSQLLSSLHSIST